MNQQADTERTHAEPLREPPAKNKLETTDVFAFAAEEDRRLRAETIQRLESHKERLLDLDPDIRQEVNEELALIDREINNLVEQARIDAVAISRKGK